MSCQGVVLYAQNLTSWLSECHAGRMSDFYILTLNHGFGYYKSKCGRQVQVNACALRSLFFIVIAQLLARPAVFGNREVRPDGLPQAPLSSIWRLVNCANTAAPGAGFYLPLHGCVLPIEHLFIHCLVLQYPGLLLNTCRDVTCSGIYSSWKTPLR